MEAVRRKADGIDRGLRIFEKEAAMMTPTHRVCCRTKCWIVARLAMRLSVRVSDRLRDYVTVDGDAGLLDESHVNKLFSKETERVEAKRLIEIAKRHPKRRKNGQEGESRHYSMGDYFWSALPEEGGGE